MDNSSLLDFQNSHLTPGAGAPGSTDGTDGTLCYDNEQPGSLAIKGAQVVHDNEIIQLLFHNDPDDRLVDPSWPGGPATQYRLYPGR